MATKCASPQISFIAWQWRKRLGVGGSIDGCRVQQEVAGLSRMQPRSRASQPVSRASQPVSRASFRSAHGYDTNHYTGSSWQRLFQVP